jgi:hypothetical protein
VVEKATKARPSLPCMLDLRVEPRVGRQNGWHPVKPLGTPVFVGSIDCGLGLRWLCGGDRLGRGGTGRVGEPVATAAADNPEASPRSRSGDVVRGDEPSPLLRLTPLRPAARQESAVELPRSGSRQRL